MALTATAPSELIDQLKEILENPAVFQSSVDRINIGLAAQKSKFGGQPPKSVLDGKTSAGKYSINTVGKFSIHSTYYSFIPFRCLLAAFSG